MVDDGVDRMLQRILKFLGVGSAAIMLSGCVGLGDQAMSRLDTMMQQLANGQPGTCQSPNVADCEAEPNGMAPAAAPPAHASAPVQPAPAAAPQPAPQTIAAPSAGPPMPALPKQPIAPVKLDAQQHAALVAAVASANAGAAPVPSKDAANNVDDGDLPIYCYRRLGNVDCYARQAYGDRPIIDPPKLRASAASPLPTWAMQRERATPAQPAMTSDTSMERSSPF
jgi:hypothetical protein